MTGIGIATRGRAVSADAGEALATRGRAGHGVVSPPAVGELVVIHSVPVPLAGSYVPAEAFALVRIVSVPLQLVLARVGAVLPLVRIVSVPAILSPDAHEGPMIVGTRTRIPGTFTDASGNAIDPTTLAFRYRNPKGVSIKLVYGVDGALVRDSAGEYHVDLLLDVVGLWKYRWESTGANQESYEEVSVAVSPLSPI